MAAQFRRGVLVSACAAGAWLSMQACAVENGKRAGGFENEFGGAGGSGAGVGGTSGTTGTGAFGQGGTISLPDAGPPCPRTCSSDLHQVLDCDNKVVEECPADKGCGLDATCVSPCDASAAHRSTIGCDFYSVIPGPENETRGSCFAALIANTWTTPLTINVAQGNGAPTDAAPHTMVPVGNGGSLSYQPLTGGQLQPGEIGIVFLHQYASGDVYYTPCPAGAVPFTTTPVQVAGSGIGQAFHITTDRPIVAYDIFPYGGATSYVSSATLLVPTPSWGDNFVAVDAYQTDSALAFVNGFPHTQIVAAEDETEVTISPTAAITGGNGVMMTGQGTPATYTLNAGQFLQFQQQARLIGSPIASNKPISVWGGTACMNIPVGSAACDSAHQQLLPVQAMGNQYLGVRYRNRAGAVETVPYTIVGAVDGTVLTYDPAPPPGAPTTLTVGQSAQFNASPAFSVTSQDTDHPFYLAIHMSGGKPHAEQGDPEYVNVIPPQQYLPDYLFLTDPTYKNTHLVFTRKKNAMGTFDDVTLDCVGPISGWTAIGAAGEFEFALVDLVVGGAPQGSCNNGVHTASSTTPFGLTVWGWDRYVSYGYPAGMSVKPINTVTVPPDPLPK